MHSSASVFITSLAFIWINNWLFCTFFSASKFIATAVFSCRQSCLLLFTLVGAVGRPERQIWHLYVCLSCFMEESSETVWFWSDTWSSRACCHILCYDQSLLLPAWCQAETNQMWDGWAELWSCLFKISYYQLFFKLQQHTGVSVMELDHNILSKKSQCPSSMR